MAILSWIVFGLVIGIIAKLLMPGKDPGGFIVTILLGVAGALVGGFIGRAMGFYGAGSERWVDHVHPWCGDPARALPHVGAAPGLNQQLS